MRILIADDHVVVRRGLKDILSEDLKLAAFGEAQNAPEVFELLDQKDWDVVVLDISMPGRGGLDVLKELRVRYPRIPVLVLSMHPEEQYAVRVLKAGASGYMTKESAAEELVGAIVKVVSGRKYISSALAEKLAFDLETGVEKPPHETLSDREYQVMRMIASGKTVTGISQELSLSVKTISTYRGRILEKMRMNTNAELTHYAIRNELVE